MTQSAAIRQFHTRLQRWYQAHGRTGLPWRNTDDAYAIYISEIMLQQTQVKTVLERYYHPFLKRFPTLAALAESDADDVLTAWQGLGYYNRALNLRAAAKACNGRLPDTLDGLIALPGIGRNTAHAICAFAYHKPVPVMEANVKRVLARVFAMSEPREQELWDKAEALLDRKHPFDYNQAMMDIGAMVCTRRKPSCSQCPLNTICKGKATPESYPTPKRKKATPVHRKNIAVLRNAEGMYYATPRTGRFLNGLYHFVETAEDEQAITYRTHRLPLDKAQPLGHVRQQYSHFTLEADVWLMEVDDRHGNSWYRFPQLRTLPMSMAETKILGLIERAKTANPKIRKTTRMA